jgi:hypothetical protein
VTEDTEQRSKILDVKHSKANSHEIAQSTEHLNSAEAVYPRMSRWLFDGAFGGMEG